MKKTCFNYTGLTCVDGNCPVAKEHEKGNYNFTLKCSDCWYNKGCEDCYFSKEDGSCLLEEKED